MGNESGVDKVSVVFWEVIALHALIVAWVVGEREGKGMGFHRSANSRMCRSVDLDKEASIFTQG